MVPAAFVLLDRLPLTPNGKLDRRALPAPEPPIAVVRRLPRTPHEEVLCGLFAETLGLAQVGIDDNFFELGGDSIMSIQLVSRARKAGLMITPRAVFQHQTVATLAAVADGLRESTVTRLDIATGMLPATPIMCWLAERGGPIDRFNQAMLVTVPAALRGDHLLAPCRRCSTITRRCGCGSAMRQQDCGSTGQHSGARSGALPRPPAQPWRLEVAPPGAVSANACLRRVDIARARRRGPARRDRRACASGGRTACSGRRRMLQAVWFDAGGEDAGRLLLVIHHLAVDGVSWRILLPDLEAAWEALRRAARPRCRRRAVRSGAGHMSLWPTRRIRSGSPNCRSGPGCGTGRCCHCSTARSTARAT